MPTHDDLGLRMKEFYESVPKTRLMRRTPVMIRIDICVHSFCCKSQISGFPSYGNPVAP